jgi:hypothetical protein
MRFPSLNREWLFLIAMIVLEMAVGLTLLLIYKGINRHPWMFAGGLICIGVSVASLIWGYWSASQADRRTCGFAVLSNLLAVVLLAVAGEIIVRIGVTPSSQGLSFGQVTLAPRDWQETIKWNQNLLHRLPSNISYFVQDSLLGWTVGSSRQSKDGLYLSSKEGIRSSQAGNSYAEIRNLLRIAIVGDSYAFGLEVPFESTWGNRLEQRLPFSAQVLNFGVDGYGVDQAYLRYHRDIRPWYPDVVIFGFINHDLYRTMVVYPFISFPEWGFPFSKPRFTVDGGQLKLVATSAERPESLFSLESVAELPFVDYDPGYEKEDWKYRWYHQSYLVRLILGWFPRWPDPSPHASHAAIATVNAEILEHFVREAISEGSVPYIVYFPGRGDLSGEDRTDRDFVFSALRHKGLQYEDLTSCMRDSEHRNLFIKGHPHYSSEGNAVVAECLMPILRKEFSGKF